MTQIVLTPMGGVRSNVTDPKEDYWGNIVSVIEFEKGQLESGALKGLEDFSHVEVLFHLSDVPESSIEEGAGTHDRGRDTITGYPPHRSGRALISASGSYLG